MNQISHEGGICLVGRRKLFAWWIEGKSEGVFVTPQFYPAIIYANQSHKIHATKLGCHKFNFKNTLHSMWIHNTLKLRMNYQHNNLIS